MSLLVVCVVIAFAADSSWSLDALPSVRRMNLEVLAAAHGAMVGSRENEEDAVLSLSSG